MKKLEQYNVDVPVYSVYSAQFPPVRTFVEGVTYSYPGDLGNDEGAEYSLGKQAAELFVAAIASCSDDVTCVQEKLLASNIFNDKGISHRSIILKEIVDAKPFILWIYYL